MKARHVLFTGGKALLKRKSLFRINVTAYQYGEPPATPWLDTPATQLDPILARMKVLGWWIFRKQLDGSGDVYVALSDNSQKDLNLNIPGVKHYRAEATVQKIRLDLSSVTFESTAGNVLADATGQAYPPPHFEVDAAGTTVNSWPVLYVSGSHVQAYAAFANRALTETEVSGEFPLIFKGKVSGGHSSFTLWGENAGSVSDKVGATVYADDPLEADKVDYFKPMTIKWYYGYTNKPDFIYAGTSTNAVYVTLRSPTSGVPLYHTVVHLSCKNAAGQTSDGPAADAIFGEFTDRDVRRLSDNAQMTYWADVDHDGDADMGARQTEDLMQSADANGNCEAWSALLRDCLRAQGIGADRIRGLPVLPDKYILVKNWQINEPPSGSGAYPYIVGTDAFDLSGIPGQGNPNPPGSFTGHWITFTSCNNAYYDPSYGTPKVAGRMTAADSA